MTARGLRCTTDARLQWIGLIALTVGCVHAPMRPPIVSGGGYRSTVEYLSELIRYEMDKNSVTGLSIALVDDQRVVWAEGFGYADKDKGIRATADTIYRVGSVSKLLTDTAVMQLAEQGRLGLNQPVTDYVPGFSVRSRITSAARITPRNLMTHHSGLPRDLASGACQGPAPLNDVLLRLEDGDVASPPDLVFSYSNVGLTLLGLAIQDVSGMPFADRMQASVLAPLGMNHSSFDPWPSHSPQMSQSYRKGSLASEPSNHDVPAGGLNSSVNDLIRFLEMVFAGGRSGEHQILKPESVAEMLLPQNADTPLDLDFHIGLGWFLDRTSIANGDLLASHGGTIGQFSSQLSTLPAHKLGVVVLANSNSGTLVKHVATEALKLALEVKTGIHEPEPAPRVKVSRASRPWPAASQEEFVGDYTTILGLAHVFTQGGQLHVRARGREFDLVPRTDGKLAIDLVWLGLVHINLGPIGDAGLSRKTIAGHEVILASFDGKELLVGERLKHVGDVGPWRPLLGIYRQVNPDCTEPYIAKIQLSEAYGELFADVSWEGSGGEPYSNRMPLVSVSDDEALQVGPLAGVGEVVRRTKVDGVEALRFLGYVLTRVP